MNKIIKEMWLYFELLKNLHKLTYNEWGREYSELNIKDQISQYFNVTSNPLLNKHLKILIERKFIYASFSGYKINSSLFEQQEQFLKKYKTQLELEGLV